MEKYQPEDHPYIETKVPTQIATKELSLKGLLTNGEFPEDELEKLLRWGLVFLYFVMLWLIIAFATSPPIFSKYQGQLGTYSVNKFNSTLTTPEGKKYEFTNQNMNGVVHFTVSLGETRLFAFNTEYGAVGVDMGGLPRLTTEQVDIYHALLRVEKNFRFVSGTTYEYTGIRAEPAQAISLLGIPFFTFGMIAFFRPEQFTDLGIFCYCNKEPYFRSDKFMKTCKRTGLNFIIGSLLYVIAIKVTM